MAPSFAGVYPMSWPQVLEHLHLRITYTQIRGVGDAVVRFHKAIFYVYGTYLSIPHRLSEVTLQIPQQGRTQSRAPRFLAPFLQWETGFGSCNAPPAIKMKGTPGHFSNLLLPPSFSFSLSLSLPIFLISTFHRNRSGTCPSSREAAAAARPTPF
jgi:hypothetical protein